MAVGIQMPSKHDLPEGPLRDLTAALHDLYRRAGKPGTRSISNDVRNDQSLPDTLSHEGVSALLRGAGNPRWAKVESLVRVLAARAVGRPDIETEVHRAHELWLAVSDSAPDDGPHGLASRLRRLWPFGLESADPSGLDTAIVELDDGRICAAIRGTVDLQACGALESLLDKLTDRSASAPGHVIDMTGVDFIDSMGLSVLIRHRRSVGPQSGKLEILCSPQVLRVIRAVGLTEILNAIDGTGTEPSDAATTNQQVNN